jgi:hypothetical protein
MPPNQFIKSLPPTGNNLLHQLPIGRANVHTYDTLFPLKVRESSHF